MKNTLIKTTFIFLSYYCILIINSCCSCDQIEPDFFKTNNIRLNHIEFSFKGDTNYSFTQISNDTALKNKYGIQVQFETQTIVQKNRAFNSFINSAYACKCVNENYITKDTIEKIKIYSLLNFDANHLAGSDITAYFVSFAFQYNPTKLSKIPITEFLYKKRNENYSPYEQMPFYLDKTPEANNNKMQFAVSVEFKNGKILRDTSSIINLL
jgi:hypothetical protein